MKVMYLRGIKLYLLIAAVPALALLILIHHYAVDVPVTDQYEFVPIFQALDHGHIPFAALWAQHNEHRIFFPNLILVTVARLTHWNVLAEVYLSFLTACATFFALITVICKLVKDNVFRVVAIILSALTFFSPAQWENWLWGWQFEWFLCVGCVIWTLKLIDGLDRDSDMKKLILPGVIAFIGTFSLGSGILAWLGGLVVMVIRRHASSRIKVWLMAALLSLGLYYFHYHQPKDGLSPTDFIGHPTSFIRQLFAYIGRPISDDARVAVFAGIYIVVIYLILLAFIVYKKKVTRAAAAISLGAIGFIVGLMTGAARFDFGIAGALQSRYTAFSELILISALLLIVTLLSDGRRQKRFENRLVFISVAVLFLPAILYSWLSGLNGMRAQSQTNKYIYACSRQAHPTYACLYAIYFPSTDVALQRLDYLKQHHYGGY